MNGWRSFKKGKYDHFSSFSVERSESETSVLAMRNCWTLVLLSSTGAFHWMSELPAYLTPSESRSWCTADEGGRGELDETAIGDDGAAPFDKSAACSARLLPEDSASCVEHADKCAPSDVRCCSGSCCEFPLIKWPSGDVKQGASIVSLVV